MLFIIIAIITTRCSVIMHDNGNSTFKVHSRETKTILSLNDSVIDANIINHQEHNLCILKSKQVSFQTYTLDVLSTYNDDETDNSIISFVSSYPIKEGMILLTSDMEFYVLKFNYNRIYNSKQYANHGNPKQFGAVTWFSSLKNFTNPDDLIPSMLYTKRTNQVLIYFNDRAEIFSMDPIDKGDTEIMFYQVSAWIPRSSRGLTKEIDNYILSAVGADGMDIYEIIDENNIQLVRNVRMQDFKISNEEITVNDFAVYKRGLNQYDLFILDQNFGIIVSTFSIIDHIIHFKNIFQVGVFTNGIAIDTYNGKNVFVVQKYRIREKIVEYWVDVVNQKYEKVNEIISRQSIVDVDVAGDFAILQGLNSHQVFFSNIHKEATKTNLNQHFTQLGVRDVHFPDHESQRNFFFGITANKAFLTKYEVVPFRIECVGIQEAIGTTQSYTLVYNKTTLNENGSLNRTFINQYVQQVDVNFIQTYIFDEKYDIIMGLLAALAFIFVVLCNIILQLGLTMLYFYRKYIQEQKQLEIKLASYKQENGRGMRSTKLSMDLDSKQI